MISLKKLRDYEGFEFDVMKRVIENLFCLIADNKLNLNSIHFRKICTQIRMFLNSQKVKYISDKGRKIVEITPKEYEYYSDLSKNEKAMRGVFGLKQTAERYPDKIEFPQTEKTDKFSHLTNIFNYNVPSQNNNLGFSA